MLKSVLLCGCVGLLSFFIGDYYNLINCPDMKCPSINLTCEKPLINLSCPQLICNQKIVYPEQSLFQKIVTNFIKEKDYKPNIYDCTEFSNELSRRLEDEGWEAKRVQTRVDCNSNLFNKENCKQFSGEHDLIRIKEVYLESTNGEIISPREYQDYGIN